MLAFNTVKGILKRIISYSVALFLVSQFLSGLKISGGFATYIIAGIVLSILFMIVKPILSLVTLPLNILTLGLFSFVINAIILYLLTIIAPNISVSAFVFKGFSFLGFVAPNISFNNFFAFIAVSVLLSAVVGFLKWITEK